ncbi:PREDICTED: uncharacterized protein LOC106749303 [Dinoponera quadriceps]|uniref:Uncharacterized protein LOC106749303 n=1 Tax=Dinoponera quadriceps TaxID=609295 RepID=A0A6P3Y001_DINQU|nr:PREDICTED: uncharacterized protein LOC106749303 [Dinoponera quadriceps]
MCNNSSNEHRERESALVSPNFDDTTINTEDINLCSIVNNVCNTKKRKLMKQSKGSIKRVKFTHENKVEYMTSSDFVSEEAWLKFLRFKQSQNARIAAAQQNLSSNEKDK